MIPLIAIFIINACPFSHDVTINGQWADCTDNQQSAANMWYPTHWTPDDVLGREMK